MSGLICLREKLWTRTYSIGDQVPTCPVFTRAKIKPRSGIKVNLSRHSMLLIYILWDVQMNSYRFKWTATSSNKQLQQQLEYTLLKPDCHSWWISKMQSGREEERYAIKFCFKLGKKCHAMKAGSTAMTQRPKDRVPSGSMLALPDPRRPDRANPPTNFWWSLFLTALAWSTCTGFPLDRQSTRNTMLRF